MLMRLVLMTDGSAADLAAGDRLAQATSTFPSARTMTGCDADSSPLRICGGPKTPVREIRANEMRRAPATTSSHAIAAPPSGVSVSCGWPGVAAPPTGNRARGENVLPSREVA